MKGKNILLGMLLVLLCLAVGIGIGYVLSTKVSDNNVNDNENVSNNTNQNGGENDGKHVELEENLKKELKSTFKFAFEYYNWSNAYCGSYGNEFIEVPDSVIADYMVRYTVSSKYNSYIEMINHLKEYMTEHVIYGLSYMSKDTYIEKGDKLYCPDFGKGGNIYQLQDIIIEYSEPYDNVIYTHIKVKLVNGDETKYNSYKVNYKKKDSKWIISEYRLLEQ